MSGMAGNVSAFATVWTYDLYRAKIRKDAPDSHYLSMGRLCTVLGVLVSIATTYFVKHFHSIMDYMQALFSFFIAPLFATVLLGMFWKRTTAKGAFWGLLLGMCTSIGIFICLKFELADPGLIALNKNASAMAANMWQAIWAFLVNLVVTVTITLFTTPKPVEELDGLVYGVSPIPREAPTAWYRRPTFWVWVSLAIFVYVNLAFW